MLRVSQIKVSIDDSMEMVRQCLLSELNITDKDVLEYKIYKQSTDARRGRLGFVYTIDVAVKNEAAILNKKLPNVSLAPDVNYVFPTMGTESMNGRPVVVGFGPTGMFSALILAEMGYNPIVFERGGSVEDRVKSVQDFWKDGILDPNSNVQFGEGGAGTFSDGKLTTRVKDLRGRKVLEALVEAGAPEDILYTAHPHIGTDLLREVVKNIREKIISLGGEIHFNTTVTDFMIEEGQIKGIKIKGGNTIETEHVIIAIGHSARDSFYKLHERGVTFSQKAFAVGARIEHPQAVVNKSQYKEFAGHPKLGAAEYRFAHTASNGRGVYTFCMCPGGVVVPSSSEKGRLVTNGMSENARKEANANSGLLVQIYPSDFESDHPLAGIEFQRRLEEKAFGLGGSDYTAPAQLVGDFMKGQASKTLGTVKPSYARGVKLTNLNKLLPDYVITAMQEGIKIFDNKMRGFGMKDAILTGVETRSSSPVRMDRDSDTCQSVDVKGVYPAGEGAGYAGGIVSAGIDGIKCAEAIIRQYKK